MTVLGEVDHDFTSGTAKRSLYRPISLIIVSGVLRATDIALVAAAGLLVRLAYPSGMESVDWQEYGLAILLAMFAAGTLFQWNGLYKLPGLSAVCRAGFWGDASGPLPSPKAPSAPTVQSRPMPIRASASAPQT